MCETTIDAASLRAVFRRVSAKMTENRDYLIELDARNGDGDLGISMDAGYRAVSVYLDSAEEADLGRLFMRCGKVFNEASPSSLGTITALGFMGMAAVLKGNERVDLAGLVRAMRSGLEMIMKKAGARPGEKTILDSLHPGVQALDDAVQNGDGVKAAFEKAGAAAAEGSESTRQMRSVHGRAAYYGDKSIGVLDGGSVVGRLIFEGIAEAL